MLDVKKVGNVPKVLPESRILLRRLLETDCVTVKAYSMQPFEEEHDPNNTIRMGKAEHRFRSLEDKILEHKLKESQCGMGFAIISAIGKHKILYNLNMWGEETPYLLFPTLYVENVRKQTLKKVPVEAEGSLCVYELKVASYEAGEWAKYLRSRRTTEEKLEYLRSWAPIDLLKEKK
jgi:hypothetical protein